MTNCSNIYALLSNMSFKNAVLGDAERDEEGVNICGANITVTGNLIMAGARMYICGDNANGNGKISLNNVTIMGTSNGMDKNHDSLLMAKTDASGKSLITVNGTLTRETGANAIIDITLLKDTTSAVNIYSYMEETGRNIAEVKAGMTVMTAAKLSEEDANSFLEFLNIGDGIATFAKSGNNIIFVSASYE